MAGDGGRDGNNGQNTPVASGCQSLVCRNQLCKAYVGRTCGHSG